MAALSIEMKKKRDGSSSLSCTREDGTVTWQNHGAQGPFFALHDLTHYAVETVLGRDNSFYGLIADGWQIGDFEKPYPRGPIPAEATTTEVIVGFLDTERASRTRVSAAEFNAHAAAFREAHGGEPVELTDDELGAIRAARSDLFRRWSELDVGDTLALQFPLPSNTS